MTTRGIGRSLMAAGVVSLILYALLALRRPSTFDMNGVTLLLYAGVVLIPLGALLLWTGEMKKRGK